MGRIKVVLAVLAPLAAMSLGCQAISEQIPTLPSATPSPKATKAPLAIPVILPTPAPTPKPTPTPAPTPTPSTPAPTPPPSGGGSCSLPASNPANPSCRFDDAQLYGTVDKALTAVTQSRPDLFDLNNKVCDNCYYVKNHMAYAAAVQQELARRGVCTVYDGEELGAKNSNAFSEQYDIHLASGHMRRGYGSYRGNCVPAIF
jgi:hypothetical protein